MITPVTEALIASLRMPTRYRLARILPLIINCAEHHTYITYGELAAGDHLMANHFGYPLGRLAELIASMDDHGQQIPPITAICVNRQGSPGNGVFNILNGEEWQHACERVFNYPNWQQVCTELNASL